MHCGPANQNFGWQRIRGAYSASQTLLLVLRGTIRGGEGGRKGKRGEGEREKRDSDGGEGEVREVGTGPPIG